MSAITTKVSKGANGEEITIPKNMELNVEKVYLKKIGNTIQIIPADKPWENLIKSLDLFTNDYMETRDQPDQQSRDLLDP